LTNTGAALPEPTVAAIRRTFPNARLYSMYGLTECKRATYLPPDQLEARPRSVGIPIPGTEAWIEDEDGKVLGPGDVGELMIRGSHVMQGYWNDPEGTAEKLRPGRWPWERVLASGDLFRSDEEGYLYFVGRRDDLIKSGGEKVVPKEVEDVLHAAPGVQEVAVVGVPDRLLGQAVNAHVSAHADAALEEVTLRAYCADHLEDHMVPRRIVIHDELPRTSNGKIDRRALAGSQ
jgi:acyl-CoA synthetase (AMP-forming)/AMP-acid ligase II